MADISVEQQTGGQKTWIWALVAVLATVALMWWLARQSEEVGRVTAVQGDTAAVAGQASTAETADLAAVSQAPDTYLGRNIALSGVPVAAALGPRAFWADIPGQNPFLVILGPSVAGVDMPVAGHRLDLEGTVQPVTEEQLNDWITAGTVSEGSRDEASFATHYLLASSARTAATR